MRFPVQRRLFDWPSRDPAPLSLAIRGGAFSKTDTGTDAGACVWAGIAGRLSEAENGPVNYVNAEFNQPLSTIQVRAQSSPESDLEQRRKTNLCPPLRRPMGEVQELNLAAYCTCCGAEISLKAEVCVVCGTPRHGMIPTERPSVAPTKKEPDQQGHEKPCRPATYGAFQSRA
jgi:hypothetical protein